MSELKVDRIEAREIIIASPDGKKKITLIALNDGVGIWLGNKDGDPGSHMIGIYTLRDQIVVGLNGRSGAKGHNLALSVDTTTGEPIIQMIDSEGQTMFFTQEDLAKLKK